MTSKLIPSFASGELAPSLHSRVDLERWQTGLKTCKNFFVNTQGGVSRRTGTRYVAETKRSGLEPVKLFPMKTTTGSYQIEFSEGYIRFFKDKEIITVDEETFDVFDPTATYEIGDSVSIKSFVNVYETDGTLESPTKQLYFFAQDPSMQSIVILVEPNTSDSLTITISKTLNTARIYVYLANTTLSKNTAALIQAAIRAEGKFPFMIVVENDVYASDRTMTNGTSGGYFNKSFKCIKQVVGSVTNTSVCPIYTSVFAEISWYNTVYNSEYWEENTDIYEIETPYVNTLIYIFDLNLLKFNQSVDTLFITHPDYPTYKLICNSDANWDFELYDYVVPPFMRSNEDETHTMTLSATSGSSVTLTSSLSFFQDGHIGSYFKIYHDVAGQSVKQNFSGTGTTSSISCFGTWRFHTYFNNVSTPESDLTITIEKSTDGGSTWTTYRTFTLLNSYADTYGTEEEFCLLRMNCTAFSKGMTAVLITDPFSKAGIIKITSRTSNLVAVGTVLTDYKFAATTASYDWAESCWSLLRGYPTVSTIYQDRLIFANTYTEPSTVWFSKTGDYYSFDVSDDITDTDGISVLLTSKKLNGIIDLISSNNLIALTGNNSFLIYSNSGVFTPITTFAKPQENIEAVDISPILIGNRILYISNNTIVRDSSYDYSSDTYQGTNLNVLATHFFEGYTILDMDYKKDKNSMVYMVRSDGKLITMNYMPEQNVIAFSLHETDGYFKNVSVLDTDNGKEVWVSVKRNTYKYYIEIFEDEQTDVKLQWYVDSAVYKYNATAFTTMTGLDHLEGKVVDVLADGNVVKSLTVSSGSITLPYAVNYAIAGLPFISDLETLPINIELQGGTMQNRKNRIFSAIVIFLNSRGGYLGDRSIGTLTDTTHSDNLDEIINNREYMDLPIDLFSGKHKQVISGGWDYDKTIFFRQYDPLPTNILGIIPSFEIGG